jgi:DNA-binding LacI/PurR family transcriptional regulator
MGRKTKKISIAKLAIEAGVSEATVSRALNNRANVSEETRKKISALMSKYNFVPTPARPRAKKIVLLSGTPFIELYIGEMFSGVYDYCAQNALGASMIFKQKDDGNLLQQIREQQCSGVIVVLPEEFSAKIEELASLELPVILMGAIYKDNLGFIDHDAYSGTKTAVEYLAKLGHKNIGYMDASYVTMNHVSRVKAFENSMKKLNSDYNPDWIVQVDCNKDIYQSSYDTVQELIRKFPEITAIVTVNDSVAIGATKGIWDCGMKIPEEMSIIGFDNYRQVKFIHPSLTTINQPIREMGFAAAKSIDEFLKNPGTWSPPREIFPTELIVRESTAPPRQIIV